MPKMIEVPGMGVVEFPDGMSESQIAAAIKRSMPAQESPAREDVGMAQAALIGAGRGTDQIIQGIRQLYNKATGDQSTLDALASQEAEKKRLYEPLKQQYPIATAIGEATPSMVAPGGFVGQVAGGALAEGLKYGNAKERATGAAAGAAGGAIGGLAAPVIRKLLAPGAGSSVSRDAIDAAQRIGYKPTAGQQTQNPAMLAFENYLSRNPGSSGRMQAVQDANQAAINQAANRSIGGAGDMVDSGALAEAKNRLGDEFTRLAAKSNPDLSSNEFLNAIAKIEQSNIDLQSFANPNVTSLVDKALQLAANNNLSGTSYKTIRTRLNSQATDAYKAGDSAIGDAYSEIVSALDDAAVQGVKGAEDKAAWQTVRKQWANFKTLEKGNVAEGGNVSPARVAAQLRQKPGFRTGALRGELSDIARIGESFKTVQNPNSGQLLQQMIYGNPLTGLPALVGNKAMGAAYMSPKMQAYLKNGIIDIGQQGENTLSRLLPVTGNVGISGLLGID